MVPITTGRLVLRPFTPDDIDDMYAYEGLAGVARYLYRPPRSRERCAELIAASSGRWEQDGDSIRLANCRRDSPNAPGGARWGSEYVYAALAGDLRSP
jgi:RimJ/RimL family protein N-acetyltransferase